MFDCICIDPTAETLTLMFESHQLLSDAVPLPVAKQTANSVPESNSVEREPLGNSKLFESCLMAIGAVRSNLLVLVAPTTAG